jgi:uncharacterized protein (TIGR02611 family)
VNRDIRRRSARWRDQLRGHRVADFFYRIVVAVVGVSVLVVGIVAIPYPGPGWAIVFLGLAILATEFDRARRVLVFVRRRYDVVMAWFAQRGWPVKVLGAAFTLAIVLATLWLLGALGWSAALIGVDWPWLQSPLGFGR